MIELSHVQKTVGANTVVGIKALAAGVGEIAAVVGPVGCGKSALLPPSPGNPGPPRALSAPLASIRPKTGTNWRSRSASCSLRMAAPIMATWSTCGE